MHYIIELFKFIFTLFTKPRDIYDPKMVSAVKFALNTCSTEWNIVCNNTGVSFLSDGEYHFMVTTLERNKYTFDSTSLYTGNVGFSYEIKEVYRFTTFERMVVKRHINKLLEKIYFSSFKTNKDEIIGKLATRSLK